MTRAKTYRVTVMVLREWEVEVDALNEDDVVKLAEEEAADWCLCQEKKPSDYIEVLDYHCLGRAEKPHE